MTNKRLKLGLRAEHKSDEVMKYGIVDVFMDLIMIFGITFVVTCVITVFIVAFTGLPFTVYDIFCLSVALYILVIEKRYSKRIYRMFDRIYKFLYL